MFDIAYGCSLSVPLPDHVVFDYCNDELVVKVQEDAVRDC